MTHLVRFQPRRLDTGAQVDFWFSDGYLVTPPDDAIRPDTAAAPLLLQPLLFRRWVGKELFGPALPDLGKIVVILDDDAETAVFDHALEWARAPVRVWDCSGGRLDNAPVLLTAEVLRRPGRRGVGVEVQFEVIEAVQALKVPLHESTYGGTGGADGDAKMKDKPKPFALGKVRGLDLSPIDASLNLYQVHHGPVDEIFSVRERLQNGEDSPLYVYGGDVGAALETVAVSAGSYVTDLERGLFRTGQPFGTIRCDVVNGPVSTAGMVRVLLEAGGVVVDPLLFDSHAATWPESAGWYAPAPTLTRWDLAVKLVQGAGSWLGQARDGRYGIGVLTVPDHGTPVDLAAPVAMVASERETAYLEPVHRVVLTVAGEETTAENPAVLEAYPNAVEWRLEGFVEDPATVAARLLAARSAPSLVTRFEVYGLPAHAVAFGQVVTVGERVGRVVGLEVDRVTGRTTLDCWGTV